MHINTHKTILNVLVMKCIPLGKCVCIQYICADADRMCNYRVLLSAVGGVFDIKAIFSLLKIPAVAIIIVLKTVTGIPVGVWHSMFTLVNVEKFGIDAQTNGYIMSYVGVVTIVRGISTSNCTTSCVMHQCVNSIW